MHMHVHACACVCGQHTHLAPASSPSLFLPSTTAAAAENQGSGSRRPSCSQPPPCPRPSETPQLWGAPAPALLCVCRAPATLPHPATSSPVWGAGRDCQPRVEASEVGAPSTHPTFPFSQQLMGKHSTEARPKPASEGKQPQVCGGLEPVTCLSTVTARPRWGPRGGGWPPPPPSIEEGGQGVWDRLCLQRISPPTPPQIAPSPGQSHGRALPGPPGRTAESGGQVCSCR